MDAGYSPEIPRRAFMAVIAGGLLGAPLAAEAQRPDRIRRIGILLFSQQDLAVITPCLQELKALGYVAGKTIAMEYRDAEGKYERLAGLAVELVRLGPDVIFSFGGEQAPIVKRATASIHSRSREQRSSRERACREPRTARWECHRRHLCPRQAGRKVN